MAEAEVLAANEAFYRAFREGDQVAMAALWARRAPVACIHPAAPPLAGRDAVLQSWQEILSAPGRPEIRCRDARAFLLGEAAFVVCYEELPGGVLAATNVFVREDDAWRMVHHQAGPAPARRRPPAAQPPWPRTVH